MSFTSSRINSIHMETTGSTIESTVLDLTPGLGQTSLEAACEAMSLESLASDWTVWAKTGVSTRS